MLPLLAMKWRGLDLDDHTSHLTGCGICRSVLVLVGSTTSARIHQYVPCIFPCDRGEKDFQANPFYYRRP